MLFKKMGKHVEIFDPIVILNSENIEFKNYIRLSENSVIWGGQGLVIGNFVHIASMCVISGGGYCNIGDFVGICAGTKIITGSDDVNGDGIPSPMVPIKYRSFYRSSVTFEDHSFLGTGCIIHPGVTIGEGTVIASGSVVTKSLDPWGIYMGAPAKRVKDRKSNIILEYANKVYEETRIKYE